MKFTVEQIRAMTTVAELRSVITYINERKGDADFDVTAANALLDAVEARKAELTQAAEERARFNERVANGLEGTQARSLGDLGNASSPAATFDAGSPEYRRAFLLDLMGRGDQMTAQQRSAFMSVNGMEERVAFVHTTANTAAVMPTTLLDDIWNLIQKEHSILGDVSLYRTGSILEVLKHTGIVQGDARKVNENAANDDEQNTFIKVTLSGNDFSKHVDISYALATMSVDGFESYLVSEISSRLANALADDLVTNAIVANIAAGNKVTTKAVGKIGFDELAGVFGKIKRGRALKVYGTRSTIYSHLVGMVDTAGRPIFQPDAQAGAEGTVLGGQIKIEDSVPDGVLLIGDPKRVVYNMVHDILLEQDRDIKKHVITHSGYCRGEGVLVDPESFATLTLRTT